MVWSNPRSQLPDGVKVVLVGDGPAHGYVGAVPDQVPNEAYTMAGQTGAKAPKATDKPDPKHRAKTERNTEALKSDK